LSATGVHTRAVASVILKELVPRILKYYRWTGRSTKNSAQQHPFRAPGWKRDMTIPIWDHCWSGSAHLILPDRQLELCGSHVERNLVHAMNVRYSQIIDTKVERDSYSPAFQQRSICWSSASNGLSSKAQCYTAIID
jgi:hypothetical protein